MTAFLFDIPEQPARPIERLSAGRRRTVRQAVAITQRTHPLSLALGWHIPLHPDAYPDRGGPRCGECRFRRTVRWHNRTYPKCWVDDGARATHGAGTDCRAGWPACAEFELGDQRVDWPDAARCGPRGHQV